MDEWNAGLQAQISQLSERVAENRSDTRALYRRVEALEEGNKRLNGALLTLQRQGGAIEGIRENADKLASSLSSVSGRVSEIEKEPGERWKKIGFELIKYIVLAAAGAAIGFLMK